jgi:hypothetical protein
MYRDRSATQGRPETRVQDRSPRRPDLARPNTRLVADVPRPPLAPRERLGLMSPEERLRAYRAGVLTRAERTAWAGTYPEEVPIVNDEFEWIALNAE